MTITDMIEKYVTKNARVWSRLFVFGIATAISSYPAYLLANEAQYDCLIEPHVTAAVGSPVQGILAESLVDRGDYVKKGQAIARLESETEAADLKYATVRADMASEIAARRADLNLAKINYTRLSELKKQDLAPVQKYDEALARFEVAKASLSQAKENLKLMQLELSQAAQRVEERTLKSPIDGVVVEQHSFPGEFIYDNPVMTVAKINPLRVEVVLPARMFGHYHAGDIALIEPELKHSESLLAMVDVVDRVLDTRSGTFGIRLTLPNEELKIPGGQKCMLKFQPQLTEAVQ